MLQKKALNIPNSDYVTKSPSTSAWFKEQGEGAMDGVSEGARGGARGGISPPENVNQHKVNEKIILAAGCFWGVEAKLRRIDGVLETKVGYIGGSTQNPTYKQVCYENTKHAEACEVTFNVKKVSLFELLKTFWQIHNPTEVDRQGADVGSQYRSAIFYGNNEQREVAEKSRESAQKLFAQKIATEIIIAPQFWLAEEYHQRYIDKKNGSL